VTGPRSERERGPMPWRRKEPGRLDRVGKEKKKGRLGRLGFWPRSIVKLFFQNIFIFSNSFESIQIRFEFEWFKFDSKT
jgi:hypothetical protein